MPQELENSQRFCALYFDELNPKCYDEIMRNITLRKSLYDYKSVYMPYRNFAERTREEYLNDLNDFVDFLERLGISQVREVGIPNIERYIAHLEQNGFASLTRKRKVVTIRSFLSFLYQDGYIDNHIAKKIVLPFAETRIPHILTLTECYQLRDASASNPRDRAIIELLLQSGIKLSELTRLELNDFDFEREKANGFVRVLGCRGKKDRLVPLNSQACLALEGYWHTRNGSKNNTLFLNRFDEPLRERGVQKMLRKYLKRAGIGKAGIHTLRHTFGAHHIAQGTSLKTLQEVMGLKDSRSTSVYSTLAKTVLNEKDGVS